VELRRLNFRAAAACLGVLALLLQALVPVHLTFDLVAAVDQGRSESAHADRAERDFLAALSGHHHPRNNPDRGGANHHTDCTVCNSLGALGTLAPPLSTALPSPVLLASPPEFAALPSERSGASPAAYLSRAPPLA
jgi:Protein of unknown function (DUF2946)